MINGGETYFVSGEKNEVVHPSDPDLDIYPTGEEDGPADVSQVTEMVEARNENGQSFYHFLHEGGKNQSKHRYDFKRRVQNVPAESIMHKRWK